MIIGGAGTDILTGGDGDDLIYGFTIDIDQGVTVGLGADVLNGGDGNDELRGSAASETLLGGAGDDVLGSRGGADILDGGPGIDFGLIFRQFLDTDYTFDFSPGAAGNIVEPDGTRLIQIESLQVTGGSGVERVWGGSFFDVLLGGGNNDFLYGNEGNDLLMGEAGNDTLDGGIGDDFVEYLGVRSDYSIALVSATSVTVTDLRAGAPDGVDQVSNVEEFIFADGLFAVSDLFG